MDDINMHEAKTHLSRLVERAAKGEPFIIAKAGVPLVKVNALTAPDPSKQKRLGFMTGQAVIPADFDSMAQASIEALFFGEN